MAGPRGKSVADEFFAAQLQVVIEGEERHLLLLEVE
jgi:hypothetical protein